MGVSFKNNEFETSYFEGLVRPQMVNLGLARTVLIFPVFEPVVTVDRLSSFRSKLCNYVYGYCSDSYDSTHSKSPIDATSGNLI